MRTARPCRAAASQRRSGRVIAPWGGRDTYDHSVARTSSCCRSASRTSLLISSAPRYGITHLLRLDLVQRCIQENERWNQAGLRREAALTLEVVRGGVGGAGCSAARAPRDAFRYVAHLVADDAYVGYETDRSDDPLVINNQLSDLLADLHAWALFDTRARAQQVHGLEQVGVGRLRPLFAVRR